MSLYTSDHAWHVDPDGAYAAIPTHVRDNAAEAMRVRTEIAGGAGPFFLAQVDAAGHHLYHIPCPADLREAKRRRRAEADERDVPLNYIILTDRNGTVL